MAADPSGPPPKARVDAVVVEQVGDELLIYDLKRDKAHSLNETAARVFRHCDGKRRAPELATLLSDESGQVVDEELVRGALSRLSEARLLAEPLAPGEDRGWSRREAMRKLGYVGAAGLAFPVVKSIVAPTSASAGTTACAGLDASCGNASGFNGPCGTFTGVMCCPGTTCTNTQPDNQFGHECVCRPTPP